MTIADWNWLDEDVEHLAEHRVRPADVLAVWREAPKYRRNRRNRASSHQMTGPHQEGAFFAFFIREDETAIARYHGRRATAAERAWWERS